MADVGMVKVLRAKCDELEDQLDEAEQSRDRMRETNKQLEADVLALREELALAKEAMEFARQNSDDRHEFRRPLAEVEATANAAEHAEGGLLRRVEEMQATAEKAKHAEARILERLEEMEVSSSQRCVARDLLLQDAGDADWVVLRERLEGVEAEREMVVEAAHSRFEQLLQEQLQIVEATHESAAQTMEEELRVVIERLAKFEVVADARSNEAYEVLEPLKRRVDSAEEAREVAEKAEVVLSQRLLEAEAARYLVHEAESALSKRHLDMQEQLQQASEAHATERQRGEDLQVSLSRMQTAHQDLFTKYSSALEELDHLKGESVRTSQLCDQLQCSLEEERRLRAEREDAQLSVRDVLISVTFDGVPNPLQVRPWDTNFVDVVDTWLRDNHRSATLLNSVVAYLRHLEDTAEAFPVRDQAKLTEVHAQFAV